MKNIIYIITLVCVLTASATEKANRFAIKSGYVKYSLQGNTTGSKTVYWDNYGENTRTEINSKTVTKMFGFSNEDKTHTITVTLKDKFWTADLLAKEGYNGTIPYYNEMKKNIEEMSKEEQEQFEKDLLASLGGKKTGTEKVLGYNCDIITVIGTKLWIYKGLNLKTEANIMGIKHNETAIEFKPDTKVPKDIFKPSTDVKYTNVQKQQSEASASLAGIFGSENNSSKKQEGGIAGLFGALTAEVDNDEDEDEDEEDIVPIKYPFESFKNAVAKAKIPAGYKPMGVSNMEQETYMANYMGVGKIIMITADAYFKTDINEYPDDFDEFKHKGKKCKYGEMKDEEEESIEGTMLIVEYPEKKINLRIVSTPKKMTKDELLQIADSIILK